MHRSRQIQALFDNGHQNIAAHRTPDLRLDSIHTCADKGLGAQVLFDPFEKQLQLPAALIQLGYLSCLQVKVVGQKRDAARLLGDVKLNAQ